MSCNCFNCQRGISPCATNGKPGTYWTKQSHTKAYNVQLRGRLIDTVWFTGYTADEAKRSLIEHDGYDPAITVSVRQ